jgi:cell cycle sensor histidine kinase DivJ
LADDADVQTTAAPEPVRGDAVLRAALVQHLAWSGVTLLVLSVLALRGGVALTTVFALLLGALPGLAAQLLRLRDEPILRHGLLGLWALCSVLAVGMTGGAAGPLAAWCAAPLAAAAMFDRPRMISGGAALSLVVWLAGIGSGLVWPVELPLPGAGTLLGGLAVGTVGVTLAAAMVSSLNRRAGRLESAEDRAARLAVLLAEQPHLILTVDSTGRLASAFGAPPPGFSVDELFAQGLIASAHHPDRPALQTALVRAATHGQAEVGFAPRAALDRWSSVAFRRLDDGRLIGVLRDATVEHAREAALDAARAEAVALNAGKSRFLANMSHELRTPLNAVIGFSDIMRQRLFGPMPDKYAEYAQLIHESGGHLLDLISDVLDMSKIEAARYELHKESFDAREPVSAALRLVRLQAHEAEISLRGVLPPEAVPVEADRRALKQIVLNLLSNALKFTPAGGSVTVTLEARGAVLEVVVADTGVGVAEEDLQRLGRPFEQAGDAGQKAMGTGLGLSLVRAFAQLHGGEMTIESRLGEGTAVTVRMPVVEVQQNGPRQGGGATVIPLDARR